MIDYKDELYHHGIKDMRWGVRRYQNYDGSLTAAGQKRYGSGVSASASAKRAYKDYHKEVYYKKPSVPQPTEGAFYSGIVISKMGEKRASELVKNAGFPPEQTPEQHRQLASNVKKEIPDVLAYEIMNEHWQAGDYLHDAQTDIGEFEDNIEYARAFSNWMRKKYPDVYAGNVEYASSILSARGDPDTGRVLEYMPKEYKKQWEDYRAKHNLGTEEQYDSIRDTIAKSVNEVLDTNSMPSNSWGARYDIVKELIKKYDKRG